MQGGALDVTAMGDGDDHVFLLDEVFVVAAVPRGGDFGHARRRVLIADRLQFLAHHLVQLAPVGEDREVVFDLGREFFQLVADLVAAERGQAVQTQVEDRLHLPFGQAVGAAVFVGAGLDRLD